MIQRPRSVIVRTRYITASTRPQARLQPSAAASSERTSARPDSATEIAPTKVSAMNRPNSISETRSTGSSTGSRSGAGRRPGSSVSVVMGFAGAGRPPCAQNFSVT